MLSKIKTDLMLLRVYFCFQCWRDCFSYVCWKQNFILVITTLALIVSVKTQAAGDGEELTNQGVGNGNPVIGKGKADDARCLECHGVDGISINDKIPNHAGQYPAYLRKQLSNFQSGERRHEIMTIMAEGLDDTDKSDIAAYFATQKIMQGDGSGDKPLVKNLFINGDKSRDLPSCVSCHGDRGKGRIANNVVYPVIGGQRAIYLRTQLIGWKLGDRSNSPGDVMNKVAKLLSEDEINALGDYISGL